jgi:hypothetical protein
VLCSFFGESFLNAPDAIDFMRKRDSIANPLNAVRNEHDKLTLESKLPQSENRLKVITLNLRKATKVENDKRIIPLALWQCPEVIEKPAALMRHVTSNH